MSWTECGDYTDIAIQWGSDMRATKLSLFIILMAGLAACQAPPASQAPPAKDGQYRNWIIGTWYETERFPGTIFEFDESTYFPSGVVCGYILTVDKHSHFELSVFKNHWQIKNGRILTTVLASNSNFVRNLPKPIIDYIVSMNPYTMHLHEWDDPKGKVYLERKLGRDRGASLCRLFRAVMRQGVHVEAPD